jgi:hypothetical protein
VSASGFPHLPSESWEAYLDDRLEGAALARMEAHVDACADCRDALLLADPSRAFRALREPEPVAWDGFWEELRPQLGPPARTRSIRRRAITGLLAAACAVLATGIAFRVSRPPARTEDPCTRAAMAGLRLTHEECEALYGAPIEDPAPSRVIREDLDLRGL